MANIIKIKRGLSTNISKLSLAPGELAVTLDTRNLYMGDSNGVTKQINTKGDPGNPGVYIGDTEPTDENVNVWIDPESNATVSADQIIFSDGDSLQDKFNNGSIGGGINITEVLEGSY